MRECCAGKLEVRGRAMHNVGTLEQIRVRQAGGCKQITGRREAGSTRRESFRELNPGGEGASYDGARGESRDGMQVLCSVVNRELNFGRRMVWTARQDGGEVGARSFAGVTPGPPPPRAGYGGEGPQGKAELSVANKGGAAAVACGGGLCYIYKAMQV